MELVFDIKRFSINDGPGIRTTLFLKGCPLHCIWCHNPEGISIHPEKLYTAKKCIGCSSCVDACPESLLHLTQNGITGISDSHCLLCSKCVDACPSKALEMSGRKWTVEDLLEVVEKERKVMEDSGGGVTLCGGEPLMHPEFTLEILEELGRRGFHRAVDTTLYANESVVRKIASKTELLLVDLKMMDSQKHNFYTGVSNEQILNNIRLVASETKVSYWIRIPLIEGVNADEDNIHQSAEFLSSLPSPPVKVNLLAYHDTGKGKHARMGTVYNPDGIQMASPTAEKLARCKQLLEEQGLNVVIGG